MTTTDRLQHLRRSRAGRAALTTLVTAVLLASVSLLVVWTSAGSSPRTVGAGGGPGSSSDGAEVAGNREGRASATTTTSVDPLDEDALDELDDSAGFGPTPTVPLDLGPGGAGGPLDPAGSAGAAYDLCAGVLARGEALLITPDPAVLPSGTMASHLTITNCTDVPVDWTAQTVPKVTLAHSSGNLAPGSTTLLGFTIDGSAYEPGAVEFKIKVVDETGSQYIDVQAFREMVGADMVADVGLTAGDQAGGCANQCITAARLSTVYNSPDVNLEMRTNVPARMTVWVSTNAPLDVGFPLFMGVPPAGQSNVLRTAWTTGIDGLAPDTTYHIVVRAIDANGNRSYRQGTFHTTSPVPQPGSLLDLGDGAACWVQCITQALVEPDSLTADLHVETHTSAMLDVYVSPHAPSEGPGGIPTFPGVAPASTTDGLDVTRWDTTITGLQPDTTYHVIVRATDLFGGRSYRAGTFRTDPGDRYVVRVEQIHVVGDGDDGSSNRGELSFRWGNAAFVIGTRGEEKIASDSVIHLNDVGMVGTDAGGYIPEVIVAAAERDADGLAELCTQGSGMPTSPTSIPDCDLKINVAIPAPVSYASLDDRLRCSHYGIDQRADAACFIAESVAGLGGDYPSFWVVISVERVG